MKLLLLAALVTLGSSKHLFGQNRLRQNQNIEQIITSYDYPVETHRVTTQDGYILQIFQISRGAQQNSQVNSQEDNEQSNEQRPAVVLMPGLMSTAEDFVYGGPSQGLAFVLADRGYDVYLANPRGSYYGQQHTTLNPAKDSAFWQYSFHEIGIYDLAATIDKVLSVSQQNKVNFVGHMEGAAAFFVLAAERPEYNQKIEKVVSLGPVAYMKSSTHPILQIIADNYDSKSWVIKNMGMNAFTPSPELLNGIQERVRMQQQTQRQEETTQNSYFSYKGYNPNYSSNDYNQTTVQQALSRVPSGGSVRQMLHWAQLKDSGRFETFRATPEKQVHEYDLSQVSVPVKLFYTPNDALSQVSDVEILASKLPHAVKKPIDNFNNNLALVYGKNLEAFNGNVADALEETQQRQQSQPWLQLSSSRRFGEERAQEVVY